MSNAPMADAFASQAYQSKGLSMTSLNYISGVFTENTGGGTMVDFVQLKDGRILAVNDEYVVLYKSMSDFEECLPINREFINLIG